MDQWVAPDAAVSQTTQSQLLADLQRDASALSHLREQLNQPHVAYHPPANTQFRNLPTSPPPAEIFSSPAAALAALAAANFSEFSEPSPPDVAVSGPRRTYGGHRSFSTPRAAGAGDLASCTVPGKTLTWRQAGGPPHSVSSPAVNLVMQQSLYPGDVSPMHVIPPPATSPARTLRQQRLAPKPARFGAVATSHTVAALLATSSRPPPPPDPAPSVAAPRTATGRSKRSGSPGDRDARRTAGGRGGPRGSNRNGAADSSRADPSGGLYRNTALAKTKPTVIARNAAPPAPPKPIELPVDGILTPASHLAPSPANSQPPVRLPPPALQEQPTPPVPQSDANHNTESPPAAVPEPPVAVEDAAAREAAEVWRQQALAAQQKTARLQALLASAIDGRKKALADADAARKAKNEAELNAHTLEHRLKVSLRMQPTGRLGMRRVSSASQSTAAPSATNAVSADIARGASRSSANSVKERSNIESTHQNDVSRDGNDATSCAADSRPDPPIPLHANEGLPGPTPAATPVQSPRKLPATSPGPRDPSSPNRIRTPSARALCQDFRMHRSMSPIRVKATAAGDYDRDRRDTLLSRQSVHLRKRERSVAQESEAICRENMVLRRAIEENRRRGEALEQREAVLAQQERHLASLVMRGKLTCFDDDVSDSDEKHSAPQEKTDIAFPEETQRVAMDLEAFAELINQQAGSPDDAAESAAMPASPRHVSTIINDDNSPLTPYPQNPRAGQEPSRERREDAASPAQSAKLRDAASPQRRSTRAAAVAAAAAFEKEMVNLLSEFMTLSRAGLTDLLSEQRAVMFELFAQENDRIATSRKELDAARILHTEREEEAAELATRVERLRSEASEMLLAREVLYSREDALAKRIAEFEQRIPLQGADSNGLKPAEAYPTAADLTGDELSKAWEDVEAARQSVEQTRESVAREVQNIMDVAASVAEREREVAIRERELSMRSQSLGVTVPAEQLSEPATAAGTASPQMLIARQLLGEQLVTKITEERACQTAEMDTLVNVNSEAEIDKFCKRALESMSWATQAQRELEDSSMLGVGFSHRPSRVLRHLNTPLQPDSATSPRREAGLQALDSRSSEPSDEELGLGDGRESHIVHVQKRIYPTPAAFPPRRRGQGLALRHSLDSSRDDYANSAQLSRTARTSHRAAPPTKPSRRRHSFDSMDSDRYRSRRRVSTADARTDTKPKHVHSRRCEDPDGVHSSCSTGTRTPTALEELQALLASSHYS